MAKTCCTYRRFGASLLGRLVLMGRLLQLVLLLLVLLLVALVLLVALLLPLPYPGLGAYVYAARAARDGGAARESAAAVSPGGVRAASLAPDCKRPPGPSAP